MESGNGVDSVMIKPLTGQLGDPGRERHFFCFFHVHTFYGALAASYSIGRGGLVLTEKATGECGRQANHSPPSGAEIKK